MSAASIKRDELLLKALIRAPENEIKFLHGAERAAADALIAQRALRTGIGHFLRHKPPPADAAGLIKSLKELAPGLKDKKYVYYNGRLFVDCFAPQWPGKPFDLGVATLMLNLGRPIGRWVPFLPSLVFSITKKCMYRCEHCYAVQSLGSEDVMSLDDMLKIARDFQKTGVGVMAWEGGEPLLRFDDLLALIRAVRGRSDSLVATTGFGLTREKARRLREAGLTTAIVSLDHHDPDRHNAFRRNPKAFDAAVNGVRLFRENGVLPSVAVCATREIMEEGGLYDYLELAKEIGAAFIQILDATPSGAYLGEDVMLSNRQLEEIKAFHRTVNSNPQYRDYPGVQARALLEGDERYGCSAGNALVYIDSSGNLQPCDLLQISFGNVVEEGVAPVFARMKRRFPHLRAGRCPAQTLRKEIKMAYDANPSLPLSCDACGKVLGKFERRDLPEHLHAIRKRTRRKTPAGTMQEIGPEG